MDKLRAMALLVATAQTGSFSQTGRKFGLSPASVSRQIAELEDRLGVTLVHRSTRNLVLSEAGQLYVRQAEMILASVDAADAGMSASMPVYVPSTAEACVPVERYAPTNGHRSSGEEPASPSTRRRNAP